MQIQPTFNVRSAASAPRGKVTAAGGASYAQDGLQLSSYAQQQAAQDVERAFANDRLYVDGDVSHAIRLVRCLSRMEVLILPKFVAERAVKRYPAIGFGEKLNLAARIYGRVVTNLLKGE